MIRAKSQSHIRRMAMLCLLASASLSGCRSARESDYVPPSAAAKAALTTALTAWKEGQPCQTISKAKTPVQPFDSQWSGGKKLKEFEILQELPGKEQKQFTVRLTLEDVPEPQEMTYYVVGKSPLLVFAEADYQKTTGAGGGN